MICFGRKLASGTGAEDVLDWVGHNLHAIRGILVVAMADQGAQRLELQCMVMRCGDSPSP
jgi:hypothetical protein